MKILSAIFFSLSCSLSSQIIHDEAVDGDLSNVVANPNTFTLTQGSNIVRGTMGTDFDLLTLTVPDGFLLYQININSYATPTSNRASYIMVWPGPILPASISDLSIENNTAINGEMNHAAFNEFSINDNTILRGILSRGSFFPGQSTLGSGQYAFWLNETGFFTTYEIDFVVIPKPDTYPQWISNFVSEPSLSDPNIAGPTGDANGDGTPNFLDYLVGNNPTNPDPNLYPKIVPSPNGFSPGMTYRRVIGGVATDAHLYQLDGVSYSVEGSTNLEPNSWISDDLQLRRRGQIIDNGDGTESITIRPNDDLNESEKVFFRLRYEEQP